MDQDTTSAAGFIRVRDRFVLVFGLIFPFLLTLVYFQWLSDYGGLPMRLAYGIGKTVQFATPLVLIAFLRREKWLIRKYSTPGFLEGIFFGSIIFVAMILLYQHWFKFNLLGPDSQASEVLGERFGKLGFADPVRFMLLGVFYSLIHSGLEEYYWRWFAYGFGMRVFGWKPALFLSSLGFTFHHIVILGNFFGYANPWTWLFSFAVGIGGAYWCWLYRRSSSIWGPWISHALIDAAIFAIGHRMLFV